MKKIAYLLSIGLLFTLLGCGTSVTTKETPADASKKVKVIAPAPPLSSKNTPEISRDEFALIKIGMSYEEVTAIIGSPGEKVAEIFTPGDQYYSVTYYFMGTSDILSNGTSAHLMFQNGYLRGMNQTGLMRPDSPV